MSFQRGAGARPGKPGVEPDQMMARDEPGKNQEDARLGALVLAGVLNGLRCVPQPPGGEGRWPGVKCALRPGPIQGLDPSAYQAGACILRLSILYDQSLFPGMAKFLESHLWAQREDRDRRLHFEKRVFKDQTNFQL